MISLIGMGCWSVLGALGPALLIAFTLTKILLSGGRPVMVYLVFSVSSGLATIHSSATGKTEL
uniref:Uncharacterized protein n=1 Tax=Anguilla anguilla TaxID=7936 RepID=A0A0E9U8I5_ANGAN